MPSRTPTVAAFPTGIPVFLGRSHVCRMPPEVLPSLLLFDDWDILWVRAGSLTWEFAGGASVTARRDEFAIIPPFAPARPTRPVTPLEYWYCHVDFRPTPAKLLERFLPDARGTAPRTFLPLHFRAGDAPQVREAYEELIQVPFGEPGGYWRMERATLRLVEQLALFAERWTAAGNTGSTLDPGEATDRRIVRIREKIELDPARPWKVADLARAEGVSPSHLHNLSTAALGMSMKEFIVRARLRHALGLMQHAPGAAPLSIKEVSALAGFESQHYFSRLFKQRFGLSPSAYREQAGDW